MATAISSTDKGFDRIARVYDLLAFFVFGRQIKKAQRVFLSRIPRGSNVLIIGGGTGWIVKQLMKVRPSSNVLYIEASPRMLKKAQKRLKAHKDSIEYRLGNENQIKITDKVDVVVTPFILDVFDENRLDHVVKILDQSLVEGGSWLFSDFTIPAGKGRKSAKILIWIMYRFFRLVCGIPAKKLPDFEKHFRNHRYQCMDDALFYRRMIQSQWLVKSR